MPAVRSAGSVSGWPARRSSTLVKPGTCAEAEPGVGRDARLVCCLDAELGEPLVHEESLGATVGRDISSLGRGEMPVDRRQVPASLQRGQVDLDRRAAVREQRGDAVAGLEAARPECMRQLVDATEQVTRRVLGAIGIYHCDPARIILRPAPEPLRSHCHLPARCCSSIDGTTRTGSNLAASVPIEHHITGLCGRLMRGSAIRPGLWFLPRPRIRSTRRSPREAAAGGRAPRGRGPPGRRSADQRPEPSVISLSDDFAVLTAAAMLCGVVVSVPFSKTNAVAPVLGLTSEMF